MDGIKPSRYIPDFDDKVEWLWNVVQKDESIMRGLRDAIVGTNNFKWDAHEELIRKAIGQFVESYGGYDVRDMSLVRPFVPYFFYEALLEDLDQVMETERQKIVAAEQEENQAQAARAKARASVDVQRVTPAGVPGIEAAR